MNDPRGSQWRIWDLQIHTPHSTLNNQFHQDFDAFAASLFELAVEAQVAVVGVTDYFLIDGYRELRRILADPVRLAGICRPDIIDRVKRICFLPNVEFRTSTIVRGKDGKDSRVNLHVIFSDEVAVDDIEEHFLRELKFRAESGPSSKDEFWSLTRRHLEDLGKNLKDQHAPFRDRSDLRVGMENAVIAHSDISDVLEATPSRFKNRYVIAVPADEDLSKCHWDGQGHHERKGLIKKSHFLFSPNTGTREWALGKRHESPKDFEREFQSLKPCLHSSDAHDTASLFQPDKERFTWVKADPTFHGLLRILHEPETRVFIGRKPGALERQSQNRTRIIESISFTKKPDSKLPESWFSGEIPLNSGLIAIIGNKGSGKSALVDTIGLLGNSSREAHFSFLQPERFRRPKEGKASEFTATIRWLSGDESTRDLHQSVPVGSVESIRYLPQNFVEEICTEIAAGEQSGFLNELNRVIFSHIPEADRLSCTSLDDLLAFHSGPALNAITTLRTKVHALNLEILKLRERSTKEFRFTIEESLRKKKEELASHDLNAPLFVPPPEEDAALTTQSTSLAHDLELLRERRRTIQSTLAHVNRRLQANVRRVALAAKLKDKLEELRQHVIAVRADCTECVELGVSFDSIVDFRMDLGGLDAIAQTATADQEECRSDIGRLEAEDQELVTKAGDIQSAVDAPVRAHQRYLDERSDWERTREAIVGSTEAIGTLAYFEAQLAALGRNPEKALALERQRSDATSAIHDQLRRIEETYRSLLSAPFESATETDPPLGANLLGLDVSIRDSGFRSEFLKHINQGRRSTFCGAEEGARAVDEYLSLADLATGSGVVELVTKIERALSFDLRNDPPEEIRLGEILKKGSEPVQVLDFVFGLQFLRPHYSLTWERRPIDQLSAGERGALLLVFYLSFDSEEIPLVIDQPEENLDNETIYRVLVPAIRQAKERRQVVIVTHNPNLAVVCDADQIIHCTISRSDGNRITYDSGAIEHPKMNPRIVDVLEGTRPAFDVRDAKYKLFERRR